MVGSDRAHWGNLEKLRLAILFALRFPDDSADLDHHFAEIIRLLHRIKDTGAQHLGPGLRFEIATRDNGADIRFDLFHPQNNLLTVQPWQAQITDYEADFIGMSLKHLQRFQAILRAQNAIAI